MSPGRVARCASVLLLLWLALQCIRPNPCSAEGRSNFRVFDGSWEIDPLPGLPRLKLVIGSDLNKEIRSGLTFTLVTEGPGSTRTVQLSGRTSARDGAKIIASYRAEEGTADIYDRFGTRGRFEASIDSSTYRRLIGRFVPLNRSGMTPVPFTAASGFLWRNDARAVLGLEVGRHRAFKVGEWIPFTARVKNRGPAGMPYDKGRLVVAIDNLATEIEVTRQQNMRCGPAGPAGVVGGLLCKIDSLGPGRTSAAVRYRVRAPAALAGKRLASMAAILPADEQDTSVGILGSPRRSYVSIARGSDNGIRPSLSGLWRNGAFGNYVYFSSPLGYLECITPRLRPFGFQLGEAVVKNLFHAADGIGYVAEALSRGYGGANPTWLPYDFQYVGDGKYLAAGSVVWTKVPAGVSTSSCSDP